MPRHDEKPKDAVEIDHPAVGIRVAEALLIVHALHFGGQQGSRLSKRGMNSGLPMMLRSPSGEIRLEVSYSSKVFRSSIRQTCSETAIYVRLSDFSILLAAETRRPN